MEEKSQLEQLRSEISSIDTKLVKLLEQRLEVVLAVGDYKKRHGLPVLDQKREVKVLEQISSQVADEAFAIAIKRIYQTLMDEAKRLEE